MNTEEFNPELHLLAIAADREILAQLTLDLSTRIAELIAQLKQQYPLPDIIIYMSNDSQRLILAIYAEIEHYLSTGKTGFWSIWPDMKFESEQEMSEILPLINKLLNSVGLVAKSFYSCAIRVMVIE